MAKDKEPTFLGGIKLTNGKELETTSPEEIYWFHKTNGRTITEPKSSKRGGKSKGARGRGRKTARQPREERI